MHNVRFAQETQRVKLWVQMNTSTEGRLDWLTFPLGQPERSAPYDLVAVSELVNRQPLAVYRVIAETEKTDPAPGLQLFAAWTERLEFLVTAGIVDCTRRPNRY